MRQFLLYAMMMCGATGAYAQTNMTGRIINPSFENGIDGWVSDGLAPQTNTSFALKKGSTYVERWTSKGSKVSDASIQQSISQLPAGTYTITAVAQNIQQDTPDKVQTGVKLMAGKNSAAVNVAGTYSVTTSVGNDGKLTISLQVKNATGNYVCLDDFHLTLDACTLEQLAALLPAAQELVDKKMNSKVLANLNAAIAAAQAQTSEEGITDVAAKLSDCTIEANASIEAHATLDKMLEEAQQLAGLKMQASVLTALTAALDAAQALTVDDDITAGSKKLATSIETAKASVADYAALAKELDEANDYMGKEPANGAEALKEAIDKAQAVYDTATEGAKGTAAAVKALASALITCHVANATGKAPVVTAEHFMPVGCAAALGRMTASGSSIIEKGYVWATHPNPTVGDDRSTKVYSNNGDIYELSPLEPATCYYVRAYAMTKTYAVGYGEEVRIYTLPKATCRWSYDEAGDDATNDRIRNAVKTSCDLYNTWTSIPGFHLNAHYVPGAGAGDGTADCSYGGYMRVSQSVSYQRTGTLLHESNHGVGVGTSARWKNWDGSNMRADGGERGQWMGWRATQMVRFFDHNETSILNGDGTHMWPYGINGAHEDHDKMIEYIANVLITHAVHQDGLAAVDGIGASPAYTFEHSDDAKYYITSASDAHGAGTSFLYETATGTLKWAEAKDTTLAANDSYAWQFEYVPAKAYYRIRNVASGKYFTYSISGSNASIKTAKKSNPGASENFQLMIAYDEVTVGEDKTVTKRPYYIQAGTGDFAPYVLNTSTKGATNAVKLNLNRNTSSTQHWVILTQDEAMAIGSARIETHTDRLQRLINGTKAMMAVPHNEKKEGATATIGAAVNDTEAKAADVNTIKDAKSIATTLTKSINNFIDEAYPSDIAQPYDLTFLIEDPTFAGNGYWDANDQAEPTVVDGVATVEGAKFKFTQTLEDMPKGVYALKVQAYQTVEPTSYIFIGSTANKAIINHESHEDVATGSLENGNYDNYATVKRLSRGALPLGITNTKAVEGDKTVFGNFRLYYYGNDFTKANVDEEIIANPVEGIAAGNAAPSCIYDLSGRRIDTPARGIYIKDGKKIVIKK